LKKELGEGIPKGPHALRGGEETLNDRRSTDGARRRPKGPRTDQSTV